MVEFFLFINFNGKVFNDDNTAQQKFNCNLRIGFTYDLYFGVILLQQEVPKAKIIHILNAKNV